MMNLQRKLWIMKSQNDKFKNGSDSEVNIEKMHEQTHLPKIMISRFAQGKFYTITVAINLFIEASRIKSSENCIDSRSTCTLPDLHL